jgi:hypothetical protein
MLLPSRKENAKITMPKLRASTMIFTKHPRRLKSFRNLLMPKTMNLEKLQRTLTKPVLSSLELKMITLDSQLKFKLSKETLMDNSARKVICKDKLKMRMVETETCKLNFSKERLN